MKVMVHDKEYDLKSARFDRVNNAHVRKDASAPDWAIGQPMPIVYQWYSRKGVVDIDNLPSPHGVEVDVSQCNIFTHRMDDRCTESIILGGLLVPSLPLVDLPLLGLPFPGDAAFSAARASGGGAMYNKYCFCVKMLHCKTPSSTP